MFHVSIEIRSRRGDEGDSMVRRGSADEFAFNAFEIGDADAMLGHDNLGLMCNSGTFSIKLVLSRLAGKSISRREKTSLSRKLGRLN